MKQVRIGVIGTGKIGCEHIARIAKKIKNADVVACADTNHEFAASVAERFGIRCFRTEEELIRSPEVDAILVAASDVLHEQYALEAIAQHKYILVEKPLAPDSAACRRIVDAEMAGGKRFVNVAYMRRYDPYYRDLKRTLERENLGEPLMLHCVHRNYDAIRTHRTHSTIENSLVHEVDICRWLLGENFKSVQIKLPKCSRRAVEVFQDPQLMYLETESGVCIDVEGFICTNTAYEIGCEVCCENGIVRLAQPPATEVSTEGFTKHSLEKDWAGRFEEAYTTEIQEWVNAVLKDQQEGPTAWDGYVASIVATAAQESLKTGEKLMLQIEATPEFYKD